MPDSGSETGVYREAGPGYRKPRSRRRRSLGEDRVRALVCAYSHAQTAVRVATLRWPRRPAGSRVEPPLPSRQGECLVVDNAAP